VIYFACKLCRTPLSAQDAQAGQPMRCPNCLSAVTVPAAEKPPVEKPPSPPQSPKPPQSTSVAATVRRPPPTQYGRRYGFNCVYCSSRLEATEMMAGHEGQCPTCGQAIIIPMQDKYGRLIDPITQEVLKQDPHPVHAYAAAGERAPKIVRDDNGIQLIVCPKCKRSSSISSNSCTYCGMPFTMEGTAPEPAGSAAGFATASMVLGLTGLLFFCTVIVPVLAIIFGAISLAKQKAEKSGQAQAITGLVCGLIGVGIAIYWYSR
jgi:DNA-directed RNA polymerase subunit RPC12/RpoP